MTHNLTPPIYLDPVVDITDNSKLETYKLCPRKFFFTHILGWKSRYPDINLTHGRAYHAGQEIIAEKGCSLSNLEEIMEAYLTEYREAYSPAVDDDNNPKNPKKAEEAFKVYISQYKDFYSAHEVLYYEVGVPVSLGESRTYHTKIDLILRNKQTGKIIFLDHKTGSRDMSTDQQMWQGRNQFMGYLHSGYSAYPFHLVDGLIVDQMIFYKSQSCKPKRVWVRKSPEQMNAWLTNIRIWYDKLQDDFLTLMSETPDQPVMKSFPQCDKGCMDYMRLCPFHTICWSTPNPLRQYQTPEDCPAEFKVEHWDPSIDPCSFKLDTETGNLTKVEKEKRTIKIHDPEKPGMDIPLTGMLSAIMNAGREKK